MSALSPEPASCSHLPRAAAAPSIALAAEGQPRHVMLSGRKRPEELGGIINCRTNMASMSLSSVLPSV